MAKYPSKIQVIKPQSFEGDKHYYQKVLNAQIHPIVKFFMNLNVENIITRYCHLHPTVNPEYLKKMLEYQPKAIHWLGSDMLHATTKEGNRKVVLIESNSSPSGQKSMPLLEEHSELGGYERLITNSFLPRLEGHEQKLDQDTKVKLKDAKLAVLFDKNEMEASGYAAAIAQLTNEEVYLVPYFKEQSTSYKWKDQILYIRHEKNTIPIRAAYRYVTQKPWNKIPVNTKTFIYNPIIACLAGGRNKLVASKAYELFNAQIKRHGLQIVTPYTKDIRKTEIPLWIRRFQGNAVIKIPYLNAGQGVFTITTKEELDNFMNQKFDYNQFIIQSLIGNYKWSSDSPKGTFFHIGTVPNKKSEIFAFDIRVMVMATPEGIKPVAMYARRAESPLKENIESGEDSWKMLGTNLSIKNKDGSWSTDTSRLVVMDQREFNKLGISFDELVESYIQSVLAMVAIDKVGTQLLNKDGDLKKKLFRSLNSDKQLIDEII